MSAQTAYEARALPLRSSGFETPGGWVLDSNGYVGGYLRVARDGRVEITVRARGHADRGERPRLGIAVAHSRSEFEVDAEARELHHEVSLPAGTYFLRLEYTNDAPDTSRELTLKRLSVRGASLIPRSTDELALAAAQTYIDHFRRGQAVVRLAGVARGASVKVKLVRHAFNFGTNVPFAENRLIPTTIEPASDAEKFQAMLAGRFNTVVLSNGGKWVYQEQIRDKPRYGYIDRFLDFAEEQGLRARMHTMIWDTVQEPPWVAASSGPIPGLLTRAYSGDERAKAELRAEISERIADYVEKRAQRYLELDLINESVHKKRYLEVYGEPGIAGIFRETAEAAAKAGATTKLGLNEYNVLQWSVDPLGGGSDPYASWYLRHADALRREGARVDLLGVQYYADGRGAEQIGSNAHSPARIAAALQNLSVGGARLALTEFEVRTGTATRRRAARLLEDTMRLVFGTPQADTFMIWAIWAKAASTPEPASTLFDMAGALTEVGQAYDRLMREFTTELEFVAGDGGMLGFSGFYGDYLVTSGGREWRFTLAKGTQDYAP